MRRLMQRVDMLVEMDGNMTFETAYNITKA